MNIRKLAVVIIIFLSMPGLAVSQTKELRGTWIAWAGDNVPSKQKIFQMMSDVAANNMNAVYVDVWRFGYPYFRSEVFSDITGLWTDPGIEQGRDVLADMIAEAHRVGLEIEAWFEAGFAACHESNDDLFDAHPNWFARKSNGSLDFYADGGIRYRWLSHCNREAQRFLIDLCLEVAQKYDVDGIEFDRVRYPELDCGYDSATVALYKSEHNGQAPPSAYWDGNWIRWRADKLNEFTAMLYDSIKAVNPNLTVSNAPLWYGYQEFCQDWPSWINTGNLDVVIPQIYFASNSSFTSRLDVELKKVTDHSKFYPGISTVANSVVTPINDLIAMIENSRNRGLQGHVIWYYANLKNYFTSLKATVYQNPVQIPYRSHDWRLPAIVINEDDPAIQKSNNWITYSTIPGFTGGCVYVKTYQPAWIEYYADILKDGWYEIYSYVITQWSATTRAPYQIYSVKGVDTVFVDQRKTGLSRWYKLGDFYLSQGANQRIIRLTNDGVGDNILFTDAVMVLNSNRMERWITHTMQSEKTDFPQQFELFQNFPNPCNPSTMLRFSLSQNDYVSLKIYDILGREVVDVINQPLTAGAHSIYLNTSELASGIYLISLTAGSYSDTKKMAIVK